MNILRTAPLAAALFAIALPLYAAPEVGQPAPAFTATDSTGATHSLGDFAGKTVVMEWTNVGCPYVAKHYDTGNMQALQQDAADDGVVWLRVISSAPGEQGHLTPSESLALIDEQGAVLAAELLDPDGTVGRAYGATVTPHMYVIDGAGVLRYMGAIDDKPSTNKRTVEGATNYVTAALAALDAGAAVDPAITQPYGCGVKYGPVTN